MTIYCPDCGEGLYASTTAHRCENRAYFSENEDNDPLLSYFPPHARASVLFDEMKNEIDRLTTELAYSNRCKEWLEVQLDNAESLLTELNNTVYELESRNNDLEEALSGAQEELRMAWNETQEMMEGYDQ